MIPRHTTFALLLTSSLLASGCHVSQRSQQDSLTASSNETRQLIARNEHLREDLIQVTDGVYTATGFSPANVSMIEGETGLIIVDAAMTPSHAERILAAFRRVSKKPIVALIYTHGHGDHTGGASVFVSEQTQVWARPNINDEGNSFASSGIKINGLRGARQGGFRLPEELRINNGVARAFPVAKDRNAFAGGEGGFVEPTHYFAGDEQTIKIDGVEIQFVNAPGETNDELFVFLPEQDVLFTGDNFYQSWPNLYAIRGTPYRDVQAWANSIDRMLTKNAKYLVPGHTRTISGTENVRQALTDYRDAIRFVFERTVEGINQGMTPDELVAFVQLPDHLSEKEYLQEYYGNIDWAVRAIFSGYLGWFDGNATNLFPLPPREEAQRMVKLAGGRDALLDVAVTALAEDDPKWAARLCDYLLAIDPDAREPRLVKADALTRIAEDTLTATGRNYLLTAAQELRADSIP